MTDSDPPVVVALPPQPPEQRSVAPTTTAQQDITTHGQRRINLIWEVTQAVVAVAVTIATLFVAGNLALKDQPGDAAFLLLSNAFFLIVGFYFSRTNHQAIGGIGPKADEGQDYRGR